MSDDKDNNPLIEEDELAIPSDHIEVREFKHQTQPGRLQRLFDFVLGAANNTSEAIDDSYSVFSSFESHGVTLNRFLFIILGALLTLNYFISAFRRRKKARKSFREVLRSVGDNVISESQFTLWKTNLEQLGEDQFANNIEAMIKDSYPNDLLEKVLCEQERITRLRDDFIARLDASDTDHMPALLKSQLDTIQFLHAQLALTTEYTASKIKNDDAIFSALTPDPGALQHQIKPFWHHRLRLGLKKIWRSILHNYIDIFSGITLSGTFGSIILSFTGVGIVTLFPWNLLFATALVGITTCTSFLSKRYFRKKLRCLQNYKQNIKHSLHNKRELTDLLITSIDLKQQLNIAIEDFDLLHDELNDNPPDEQDNYQATLLRAAIEGTAPERTQGRKKEFVEITQYKKQPKHLRHFMMYLLPTVFAVSSGYGIGATLLQLTLLAGIGTSLLPFIVIGLTCVCGYSLHALHRSYRLIQQESKKLDMMNRSILSDSKLQILNNRLKLNYRYGITYNHQIYSLDGYMKTLNGDAICAHVIETIASMKRQFDATQSVELEEVFSPNTRAELVRVQEHLIDRLTLQSLKIHSKSLASKLRLQLRGIQPLDIEEPNRPRFFKEKLTHGFQSVATYLHKNLKIIAEGTTFGLSTSASFLLIFGTASLFSLSTTILVLIVGALVGSAISLLNDHVKFIQHQQRNKRHQLKASLKDKGELCEMLVDTLQAHYELNSIIESHYRSRRRPYQAPERTPNTALPTRILTPQAESAQVRYCNNLVRQLAQNLSITLNPRTCRMEARIIDNAPPAQPRRARAQHAH